MVIQPLLGLDPTPCPVCGAPFRVALVLMDATTARPPLAIPSLRGASDAPAQMLMDAVEKDVLCFRCLDHRHYKAGAGGTFEEALPTTGIAGVPKVEVSVPTEFPSTNGNAIRG